MTKFYDLFSSFPSTRNIHNTFGCIWPWTHVEENWRKSPIYGDIVAGVSQYNGGQGSPGPVKGARGQGSPGPVIIFEIYIFHCNFWSCLFHYWWCYALPSLPWDIRSCPPFLFFLPLPPCGAWPFTMESNLRRAGEIKSMVQIKCSAWHYI